MSTAGMPGYKETSIGWIPDSWPVRSLEAISTDNVTYGVVQPGPEDKRGVRLVRGGDVKKGRVSTALRTISSAVSNQFSRTVLRGGELLVSLVGYPGETAIAGKELAGANIARQVGLVRLCDSNNSHFVQQYLSSPIGKKALLGGMIGSAQQVINLSALREVEVPLPQLPEQQKIAAILTAVDDKLDVIARQIEATQTLKQGLMQTLFSRGAGTQGADGRWEPHAEFKDSELGTIPAAWGISPIGSLFEVVERAVRMADEESYRRVTVKRRYGGIELRDELRGGDIKVKSQFAVEAGDFLISERQIVHGACGIVPSRLAGALVSNEYLVLKARPSVDVQYFNYLVQQLKYAKYFLLCSQGVDIEKFLFKPKDWLKKKIPVPPLKEQQRIAQVLATVEAKVRALQSMEQEYQALKRGLMQKLLTGEWRVKVDTEVVSDCSA